MLNYKNDIKGAFDTLPEDQKEVVMEVVANFHHRNGEIHSDGSMGAIKITSRQLNDCLAAMIIHST